MIKLLKTNKTPIGLFLATIVVSTTANAVPFAIGDVFAGVNNGRVQHYDDSGNLLETLDTGVGGYTTGMSFDSTGNLYVTNFSVGSISKFDTSGNLLDANFVTGLATPESIVFDNNGDFYVSQVFGSTVKKYDADGNFLTDINVGRRTDWIDLAADQTTLLYGNEGRTIYSHDVNTDTANADFATLGGSGEAFAMRILSDGGLLVADESNIKRLDSAGNLIQTYDAGIDEWFALNLDPDGTSFWSGSFGNDTFYQFDIATGNLLQSVATGFSGNNLYGLAVAGEITAGCSNCGGEGGGGDVDVPEPSTLSLLAIGLAGLPLLSRRRRKA